MSRPVNQRELAAEAMAERRREQEATLVRMGVATEDLRARYWLWAIFDNARPSHFRWDYNPTVTYIGCQAARPWSA